MLRLIRPRILTAGAGTYTHRKGAASKNSEVLDSKVGVQL